MTRRRVHRAWQSRKPRSSWPIVLLILLGIGLIGTLDYESKRQVQREWRGK